MFDRFDDSARRAVATAGQIAAHQRQDVIATNHMLFGIVAAVGQDLAPAAGDVILSLGADPQSIRDLLLGDFDEGRQMSYGHIPFTPKLRLALERAVTVADTLGSRHIGAEHLLAGLAGGSDDQAGQLLARLGFTTSAVTNAIASTGSPSPSSPRSFVVYLPVGKSVFKNGGRIYPDLASATAAHPDQDIAPFPLVLTDGEFFTLVLGHYGNKPVASFASYRDAFAAADAFRAAQGVTPTIRIMSPTVTEHRGKDTNNRDVVLGRTVDYDRVSVMSRVVAPTLHETKAAKAG